MSSYRNDLETLPPEDDWFAEEEPPADAGYDPALEETWLREPEEPTQRSRVSLVALAVLAVALLAAAGGILAWAFSGDDEPAATATTLPETVSTTPATTDTSGATTDATTTPTQTTPTTEPTATTLRPGAEGPAVRSLQEALVSLGYDTGGVDGKYGPATVEAVTAFQVASGLEADGIAGPATQAALAEAQQG